MKITIHRRMTLRMMATNNMLVAEVETTRARVVDLVATMALLAHLDRRARRKSTIATSMRTLS